MIKQKSFNYKFNDNNDNELNFFVNKTNFYAFDALMSNEIKFSFLYGPKKSGKSYLAKIWLKNNNAIEYNNNYEALLNFLNCEISYFNMFELKEIRNNLDNVSIINNLNIKKLSYKSISYEIYFYGNFKILFKIFELNKLKINYNEDKCTIKLI